MHLFYWLPPMALLLCLAGWTLPRENADMGCKVAESSRIGEYELDGATLLMRQPHIDERMAIPKSLPLRINPIAIIVAVFL